MSIDEDKLLNLQPNIEKSRLPLFNYWSERKRKNYSDDATCGKLVLDYDNGVQRSIVEDKIKDFDYIIYESTGNKPSENIEKFRVIITLKEPVKAIDLKDYRNKLCKNFFAGVDKSTFAVGRFFCIPSRYDKDGNKVNVIHHEGKPFDFYSLCPKKAHNSMTAAFDKIVEEMKFGKVKKTTDLAKAVENFQRWMDTVFPCGCHYSDVPAIATYAKGHGIDFYEASQKLKSYYAGDHMKDAERWMKKIYMK